MLHHTRIDYLGGRRRKGVGYWLIFRDFRRLLRDEFGRYIANNLVRCFP
jgi:hypothetical protein